MPLCSHLIETSRIPVALDAPTTDNLPGSPLKGESMKTAAMFLVLACVACALSAQVPTLTLVSPAQSSTVPIGPLVVEFAATNFTLGGAGQTHLHIFVDADPTPNMFYNAPTNEVQRLGAHTHFLHWNSSTSAVFNGLASGAHALRFVLASAGHVDLTNIEATFTLNITVSVPAGGDFTLTSITPSLNFPICMTFAPDGRLFYTEKESGRIRVMSAAFVLQTTPFATITGTGISGEQGMLGICLHPSFATNGFVYVYHTMTGPLRNRIVRYTEVGGIGTAFTIIKDNLPANTFHNGGNIHFGPDGFLYVTCGDAQTAANSQNLATLAGKILRLDPANGNAAPGNPFASTGGALPEIWCRGVRNSFDFCWHPDTSDLWASENGASTTDEINRIIAGANYGWPTFEGTSSGATGMTDALLDISPTVGPTGIVAVSDASSYPAAYHHNLLMADINGGRIRRVVLSGPDLRSLGATTMAYNGGQGGITDLEEAPNGFIYVFAGSGPGSGGLYRLDLLNAAPIITSTAPTTVIDGNLYTYTIAATGSPTIAYTSTALPAWLTLTGNVLSGTPTAANIGSTGNITLTATNGQGSDTQTFSITVTAAPTGGPDSGDDSSGCSTGEQWAPWLGLIAVLLTLVSLGRKRQV